MRKRSRQQPSLFTNNAHQRSSAAVSDSLSFSHFCFPFFCLLLITWIFLSTFNPALSHHTGSNSWSIPWFSGVHADENNGEHKSENNGSVSETQKHPVPSDENNPSNYVQLALENKIHRQSLVQDLKCRPPLIEEVLFLRAPLCGACSSGTCQKRSGGFRTSFNLLPKDSTRSHVSLHANDGRNEAEQYQDSRNEGPPQQEGKSNVLRDGFVNDLPLKHEVPLQHEEQDTQAPLEDDNEQQTDCQIEDIGEHRAHGHEMDGGEHHKFVNVENNTQHEAQTPLPGAELTHNESGLRETTPDILKKFPALINLSRAHLRQEPGDGLYNYAADSKGAKILASNKEAKGASNILNKDRDKYFRTPCNVGAKFVDMELSEELFIVEIGIANHEFYSSNVRGFEVWGSLTYPAEEWVSLGKFEAENIRAPQLFSLKEPQWVRVRYLKLQMISHYGADFYCTLSTVEVHGVDAIELLLEDWIAEEAGGPGAQPLPSQEKNSSIGAEGGSPTPSQSHPPERVADSEDELELTLTQKLDNAPADRGGVVSEAKGEIAEKPQPSHHQTGRPAIDAVMKLLMQKVRSLEHKEPIFSQQLKDLDEKYKEASRAHNKEQLVITSKLEEAAAEIASLNGLLQSMERKWSEERLSLQKDVLNQMREWNKDLNFLRNELSWSENKGLVALAVSFFSTITILGIQLLTLCASALKPGKQDEIMLLSGSRTVWAVPFLGCVLVVFVLSL